MEEDLGLSLKWNKFVCILPCFLVEMVSGANLKAKLQPRRPGENLKARVRLSSCRWSLELGGVAWSRFAPQNVCVVSEPRKIIW